MAERSWSWLCLTQSGAYFLEQLVETMAERSWSWLCLTQLGAYFLEQGRLAVDRR